MNNISYYSLVATVVAFSIFGLGIIAMQSGAVELETARNLVRGGGGAGIILFIVHKIAAWSQTTN